ncbi:MAG: hypothetical protein GY754_17005 [bacterium]|nr:hypothetical protein [bacterium]
MKKIYIICIIVLIFSFSCSGKNIRKDGETTSQQKTAEVSQPEKAGESASVDVTTLINAINEINDNSPDSFYASFIITGSERTKKLKKFKFYGNTRFRKKDEKMDVMFQEQVFRSHVASVYRDGEVLGIFFPVESTLYKESFRRINIKRYFKIDIGFNIIHDLIVGKIPLLENYRVKEGMVNEKKKGTFLILENEQFYETISFKGKSPGKLSPDKIMLINKFTKTKFEIYIKKYIKKNKSRYFSRIYIVDNGSKVKMNFIFNRVRLNVPVKVRSITKIPKRGLKVINQ